MENLRSLIALSLVFAALFYAGLHFSIETADERDVVEPEAGMEAEMAKMDAAMDEAAKVPLPSYEGSSISGSYLSGRFAQRHHDWKKAGTYMDYVLQDQPDSSILQKRAMVLALGAGNYERAFSFASNVVENYDQSDSLSLILLTTKALHEKDYERASAYIGNMSGGGLSTFLLPLLESWSDAALGEYNVTDLQSNSIHLYHAMLISHYMDKTQEMRSLLQKALVTGDFNVENIERLGDIYAELGEYEEAQKLYEQALKIQQGSAQIKDKLEAATNKQPSDLYIRAKSPEMGLAEAFYDMGRLLSQEYSDESARVFARMGAYIDPTFLDNTFLLANIAIRNERLDDAVALFESVPEGREEYLPARRSMAEILAEQNHTDEAIQHLEELVDSYNDLESMIQIGDIHRSEEDFPKAIQAYNRAADKITDMYGKIPEDYWHLYYVRGMSYEQNDQWKNAEADLQSALDFQPDHPYVLNYLGYAWADQGENLDRALDMISKAVELRPNDGYITDSLGWVYYRMGRYQEAVPYLEQAVELLPYDPVINDHLGDAYWKVGRKLEAEFQWNRAKNHSEDEELILKLADKLENGLINNQVVREAKTATPPSQAAEKTDDQTKMQ
ncbi:MAG: tetratricopeptide repeat protein [Alphaproteobacteria bacterium]|nr:tetratricopeptide repeat protein [Alphaproteobacteria bacterium]